MRGGGRGENIREERIEEKSENNRKIHNERRVFGHTDGRGWSVGAIGKDRAMESLYDEL